MHVLNLKKRLETHPDGISKIIINIIIIIKINYRKQPY